MARPWPVGRVVLQITALSSVSGFIRELVNDHGSSGAALQTHEAENCMDAFLNNLPILCARPSTLTMPTNANGWELHNQSAHTSSHFEGAQTAYSHCTRLGARYFGVRGILEVAATLQPGASTTVHYGVCAPHQCSAEDVANDLAPVAAQFMLGLIVQPRMTGVSVEELGNWTEMHVDFVIAGFAKCGTTSLAAYLDRHPGLQLADVGAGEPYGEDSFFVSLDLLPSRSSIRRFQQRHGRPQASVKIGIKYPHVIFRDLVLRKLLAANPAVRLVLVVRDPIDWLESTYRWYTVAEVEAPTFFDHALGLDMWKGTGLRMHNAEVHFSKWIARLRVFGVQRRQVYILHQDVLSEAAVRLCAFLGVQGPPPGKPPSLNVNDRSGFDLCEKLREGDPLTQFAVLKVSRELKHEYTAMAQLLWENGEAVPASFLQRETRCGVIVAA